MFFLLRDYCFSACITSGSCKGVDWPAIVLGLLSRLYFVWTTSVIIVLNLSGIKWRKKISGGQNDSVSITARFAISVPYRYKISTPFISLHIDQKAGLEPKSVNAQKGVSVYKRSNDTLGDLYWQCIPKLRSRVFVLYRYWYTQTFCASRVYVQVGCGRHIAWWLTPVSSPSGLMDIKVIFTAVGSWIQLLSYPGNMVCLK